MAAVKSDAAAAYKTQLMAIQAKLDEIHALREGVLEELVRGRGLPHNALALGAGAVCAHTE